MKQGPNWDRLMMKARGQKSHATAPLIHIYLYTTVYVFWVSP
jgi:hypothetical protein